MADFSFASTSVEVTAGTTVTWTNSGVAPHTATASDGSFVLLIAFAVGGFGVLLRGVARS